MKKKRQQKSDAPVKRLSTAPMIKKLRELIEFAIQIGEYTPSTLSRASGVPVSTITRFLNRERVPTFQSAAKLCEAMGLQLYQSDKIVSYE